MPEQFKPYNFDQARDEATKIEEKIKRGEAKDFREAEEKVEQDKKESETETIERELSPEMIEMIMSKVQDVNEKGTAYYVLRNYFGRGGLEKREEILRSIFKNGLFSGFPDVQVLLNSYKDKLKEKEVQVQFNIVGRNYNHAWNDNKIDIINSEYARLNNGYIFLFDISKFEEVDSADMDSEKVEKIERNQYAAARGGISNGKAVDDEFGFRLSGRLAPRYFRGIMINCKADETYRGLDTLDKELEFVRESLSNKKLLNFRFGFKTEEELLKSKGHSKGKLQERGFTESQCNTFIEYLLLEKKYYQDEKIFKVLLDRAVRCMKDIYQNKSELYNPIYDYAGNLAWPKKMTREEVKKFVEERDRKKEKGDSETSSG